MARFHSLPAPAAQRPGPIATLLRLVGAAPVRQAHAPPGDTPVPEQLRRDAGLAVTPQAPPSTGAAMLHLLR